MDINVVVGIGKHEYEYFEYFRRNILIVSSSSSKIEFFVSHDVDMPIEHVNKLKKVCELVVPYKKQAHKFMEHSSSLMSVLKNDKFKMNDGKYTLIADVDTAITLYDFDVTLQELFDKNGLDMFGVQNLPPGSFGTKIESKTRNYGYPMVQWMLMKNSTCKKIKELDFSFSGSAVPTKKEEQIFKLPNGMLLFKDTGWMIPIFIVNNNLKFNVMEVHRQKNVLQTDLCHHATENVFDGKTIVCHQGLASRVKFRDDTHPTIHSNLFYDYVDDFLRKQ